MKREKEEGGEEDERAKCKSRGSLNEISKRGEKKKKETSIRGHFRHTANSAVCLRGHSVDFGRERVGSRQGCEGAGVAE